MAFFCNKTSCKKTLLGDDTTPYITPNNPESCLLKALVSTKNIIGIPCIFSSFFSRTSLRFFVFFSVLFVWGVRFAAAPRNRPRKQPAVGVASVYLSVTPGCPNYFPSPSCALGEQRRIIPHRKKHINRAGVFGRFVFCCFLFFFILGIFFTKCCLFACFFLGFQAKRAENRKENWS